MTILGKFTHFILFKKNNKVISKILFIELFFKSPYLSWICTRISNIASFHQ